MILCIILIPPFGPTGAAAATAISYLIAAVLMIVRSERVFPVGYEGRRIIWLVAVAAVVFAAADRLPDSGPAVAARLAIGLVFPLLLFATGWLTTSERARVSASRPDVWHRRTERGARRRRLRIAEIVARGLEHPQRVCGEASAGSAPGASCGRPRSRPKRRASKPRRACVRNAGSPAGLPHERDVPAMRDRAVQPVERAHDQRPLRARRAARDLQRRVRRPACSTAFPQTGS